MESGKSRDNCFLILELPYDNPKLTEEEIAKAISTKKKLWSKPTHRKNGLRYEDYNKNLPYIKRIMNDPNTRKTEAKLADEYVRETLGKRMKMYIGTSNIGETEVVRIQDDTGISKVYLEILLPQNYGLTIVKKGEEESKNMLSDPNPKPSCVDTYKNSIKELEEMNLEDLYDFLKEDDDIDTARNLEREELLKRVEKIRNSFKIMPRTTRLTYMQDLCQLALTAFKNEQTRKGYDEFVIWEKTDRIIKSIKSVAKANGDTITGQTAENYLKAIMSARRENKEKAENRLKAIGKKEGILIVVTNSRQLNLKICPSCNNVFENKKEIRNCPKCGNSLFVKCSKCGTENDVSAKFCVKCNTSFKQLQELLAQCQVASSCIKKADLDQAKLILQRVSIIWQDLDKVETVKRELEQMEKVLGPEIRKIKENFEKKKYYTGLKRLEEIKKQYPSFQILEEDKAKAAVEEAKKRYQKIEEAEKRRETDSIIQYCEEIYRICEDYPGVREKIILYPPNPVQNVKVESNGKNKTNIVKWIPSTSKGDITYKILKKLDRKSRNSTDGKELAHISDTQFVDTNVDAGKKYYYTIFAIRSGIESRGVANEAPAINYGELKIKNIEVGEGNIRITWNALPMGARVRVWKKRGSTISKREDGSEISCRVSEMIDEAVENEITYSYLLCLEYCIGEKRVLTDGVEVSATPVAIPSPVNDLEIKYLQGSTFEAKWKKEEENGKVVLYFSKYSIPYEYGEIVNIGELRKKLNRIQEISKQKFGCRFNLEENSMYYIVAVVEKKDSAVIGEKAYASREREMEVEDTKIVGKDLHIHLKWPQNARAIVIRYRNDEYPQGMQDKASQKAYTRKHSFDKNSALIIKNIEKKKYFISLFAEMELEDDILCTQETRLIFDNEEKPNIYYGIKIQESGFIIKQPKIIEIEFYSDKPVFILPDIEIYQAKNIIPLYKKQSKLLKEIKSQEVNGSYIVRIVADELIKEKNVGIKPFFKDENEYDRAVMRAVAGTKHIVTKSK